MSEEPEPRTHDLLVDATIERALLGALLVDSSLVEPVFEIVKPNYFGFAAHATIAQAIQMVSAEAPVNSPNVARKIRQMGKLQETGGPQFLYDLEAGSPVASEVLTEDAVSWSRQLLDLWQRRALLNEARLLASKLETNSVEDAFGAVEQTAQRAELYRPSPAIAVGCWADELCSPIEEPPPIEWLLCDELSEDRAGAIPLGRVALLSAGGGTGKTTMLCQLAVAVALGLPWCGFNVKSPGCVALCCGESDKVDMQWHLWKAYNSFELDDEQRKEAAHNIYAKPLMGHIVNVVGSGNGNDFQRTPFLTQFRQELTKVSERSGNAGFALVILDPLSRFAGPDTEKDNSAATSYIAAVETLCSLPGNPTVMNAHHSSKASGQNGKNDARGVSGIVDGVRSNTTLTAFEAEKVRGVLMANTKNNLAPHFAQRWLVQERKRGLGGTLRLATESEAALLEEAAHPPKRGRIPPAPKYTDDKPPAREAILRKLETLDGVCRSRSWFEQHHSDGYRASTIREAFRELESSGLITIDTSGPTRGTVRMVGFQRQLTLNSNDSSPSQNRDGVEGRNE